MVLTGLPVNAAVVSIDKSAGQNNKQRTDDSDGRKIWKKDQNEQRRIMEFTNCMELDHRCSQQLRIMEFTYAGVVLSQGNFRITHTRGWLYHIDIGGMVLARKGLVFYGGRMQRGTYL